MSWEVLYGSEFEQWWHTLGEDEQVEIQGRVELLEHEGPSLGRPTVGTITSSSISNLKELIAQHDRAVLRVLFVFDPIRRAVLLMGGDKSVGQKWSRWYPKAIEQAERIYADYLASEQYKQDERTYRDENERRAGK